MTDRVLPTWRLLFPDLACIVSLYRTEREHEYLHGHTRLRSLREAYRWDRRARHSALADRLGVDGYFAAFLAVAIRPASKGPL
jgi:hypothetical protein